MIDFFEYIDDYHRDILSSEDRKNFEIQMTRDPELSAAVENHDIALAVLELISEEDIRDQISELELTSMTTVRKKRSIIAPIILVVIFILTLIILLIYFSDSTDQTEGLKESQLYALHYLAFHDSRTRGTSPYFQSDSTRIMADQGHALMDARLFSDAKSKFLDVLATQPNAGTEKAEWYLLLCYLVNAETVKSDSLLTKILKDQNHLYYPNAQALKKDRENFRLN